MPILLPVLIATAIVVLIAYGLIERIRFSASRYSQDDHRWWVFTPANTGALVVGKQNKNERGDTTGTVVTAGGPVIDFIHSIPGKKRNKSSSDCSGWYLEDGEEDWGFWHWITGGAHFLGPWRDLRVCTIHELRLAKQENEEAYTLESKDYDTLFPYYSGALGVRVVDAEVKGTFRLSADLNVIYERKYFVRSILRVADSNAILTLMAESRVLGAVGPLEPEAILSGKAEIKERIAASVIEIGTRAEGQIGLYVADAEIYRLGFRDKDQELFELEERTKREQAARKIAAETDRDIKVIEAEGEKKAGILKNDVQADLVERTTLRVAREPRGPAVRWAEAIEKNQHLAVLGTDGMSQMLPPELIISGDQAKK